MTDKVQKIREEVERLMNELIQEKEKGFGSDTDDTCILELQNVLTYIDSLQEEPVSEDLEEAANCYKDMITPEEVDDPEHAYSYETYTEYQIADAFISGSKWKEQQMMKNAVDGWVFRSIKDGKLRISDNKECWNGIRIPEKSIEKSYLFCTTDDAIKVKFVIIKED